MNTPTPTPDPADRIPYRVRAYLYRVATALGLVAGAYGLVSDEKLPLVLGLVATVLGTGQAVVYTPTK